jgi:hypothetical protein
MRETENPPETFREQVEAKGTVAQCLVHCAILAGYGVGTVRAHTDPVFKAVGDKIKSLVPETMEMAAHAYKYSKQEAKADEAAKMVARAAARTARRAGEALKAATA